MRRIHFAPLVVWVVTFALRIVARHDLLHSPPFQDQAVGLWTEADFLARSGFDYRRLLYDEHHSMDDEPGPRSYMISVLPTLVAIQGNRILISGESAQNAFQEVFVPASLESFASDASF